MKRNGLLILLIIVTLLCVAAPVRADKSYVAERFDVLMEVQPGGTMMVTETVVFRFDGGPFTYAFREVLATETDGVRFVEASMDGVVLPTGALPGMVDVTWDAERLKVTWHFASTTDATHTFVLRYEVLGVVRTGTANTIRWRAIPGDHEYPIAAVSVQVRSPVQAQGSPILNRAFESEQTSDGWLLTAGALAANEGLIVSVDFPSGSLVQSAPTWQVQQAGRERHAAQAGEAGLVVGLLTFVAGAVILLLVTQANRRMLKFSPSMPLAEPPADLDPTLVARLVGVPSAQSWMGVLFNLAQRGVLQIQQMKGFLGSKRYELVRLSYGGALSAVEQQVMGAVFPAQGAKVDLSQVGTRIQSVQRALRNLEVDALLQRGWLDSQRTRRRSTFLTLSVLALIGSLVMIFVGLMSTASLLQQGGGFLLVSAGMLGLGGGLFPVSVLATILASMYSPLTPVGEEQKHRWKSFGEYLRLVCRGREAAVRPDLFERYLPFAAVFGLTTQWARSFEKLGGVPLPVWFRSLSGTDADFSGFVAAMSATDSSFSSGADGGGGASGGGSSGAG